MTGSQVYPDEIVNALPAGVKSLKKSEMLNIIELMAKQTKNANEAELAQISQNYPDIVEALPLLLQYLTVPIRLFAKIENAHTIRSEYSVRYNNCFTRLPDSHVYVNNNPVIDSVGIYKVKGAHKVTYDPSRKEHQFFRLYGPDDPEAIIQTIPIDTSNYSYFIAAFTSAIDEEMTVFGNLLKEQHWTQWYYQLDSNEIESVSYDDYMAIGGMGDMLSQLIPPASKKIKSFTAWLEVSDRLPNVLNRPQGSMVKEISGKFEYLK